MFLIVKKHYSKQIICLILYYFFYGTFYQRNTKMFYYLFHCIVYQSKIKTSVLKQIHLHNYSSHLFAEDIIK